MKKILATAITAAFLLSLASCQKEELKSTKHDSTSTVRIISGTFTNGGTKTTLDTDAITPLWKVGDVVRVLDGTEYQDVTLVANGSTPGTNEGVISADSKSFSFATTLTGTQLYAVYPASATTLTSCTDGNITFTIPSAQDGSFASANICVASGDDKDNIYFSNATAVVEMSVADDVVYANLTAANKIAGDMTVAMGNKGAINSTTTTSLSSNYIFVSSAPSDSKYYMVVAPVETGAVTITCNTSSKSGSTDKTTKTLDMDKIYAMDLSEMTIATEDLTGQHGVLNGQEYVLIRAKYDGTNYSYLKWATQNLAVTASGKAKWNGTNYVIGDYFQWAASYDGYGITAETDKVPENLVIYTSFTNTFTTSGNSFSFKTGKQFDMASAPYGGDSYSKYTGADGDSKSTLEQSDDVANIVLGSTWRMPIGGRTSEFKAMNDATTWTWNSTDIGYYVTKSGVSLAMDKSNALLFFPTVGNGDGANLNKVSDYSYYWSSALGYRYSIDLDDAYFLVFCQSYIIPNNLYFRYYGFSVRPVSD